MMMEADADKPVIRRRKQEVDPSIPKPTTSTDDESRGDKVMRKVMGVVILCCALLGLKEVEFVSKCLYSPIVSRFWLNTGILFSTLVVMFGSYIELYRALFLGENVKYESAKTSTHGMLFSIISAGICFNIALWPLWQWKAPCYLFMWSWGVLFQLIVVFPPMFQRIIFGGIYLWFMHTYLSPYMI